jgi:hypothetical protein
MPRKSFRYGGDRIEYEVVFKPAKHDQVAIHVHPDGFVQSMHRRSGTCRRSIVLF